MVSRELEFIRLFDMIQCEKMLQICLCYSILLEICIEMKICILDGVLAPCFVGTIGMP